MGIVKWKGGKNIKKPHNIKPHQQKKNQPTPTLVTLILSKEQPLLLAIQEKTHETSKIFSRKKYSLENRP